MTEDKSNNIRDIPEKPKRDWSASTSFFHQNAGPLAFLIIAGLLCLMVPEAKRTEAIYLVIGAALTRVKRTDK